MAYTMDDWDRMQRDAERRVRLSREQNAQILSHAPQHRPAPPSRKKSGGLFDLLNLNRFELDGDRSLLMMMLALLSGEEKDELLTLALLYIMLKREKVFALFGNWSDESIFMTLA